MTEPSTQTTTAAPQGPTYQQMWTGLAIIAAIAVAILGAGVGIGWAVRGVREAKAGQPKPETNSAPTVVPDAKPGEREPKAKESQKWEFWTTWHALQDVPWAKNLSKEEVHYICFIVEEQHVPAKEALRQLRMNQADIYYGKHDDRTPPPNPELFGSPPNGFTPRNPVLPIPPGAPGLNPAPPRPILATLPPPTGTLTIVQPTTPTDPAR